MKYDLKFEEIRQNVTKLAKFVDDETMISILEKTFLTRLISYES